MRARANLPTESAQALAEARDGEARSRWHYMLPQRVLLRSVVRDE